jgi:hypothetical protein
MTKDHPPAVLPIPVPERIYTPHLKDCIVLFNALVL